MRSLHRLAQAEGRIALNAALGAFESNERRVRLRLLAADQVSQLASLGNAVIKREASL